LTQIASGGSSGGSVVDGDDVPGPAVGPRADAVPHIAVDFSRYPVKKVSLLAAKRGGIRPKS
jgi:hypothetical protein